MSLEETNENDGLPVVDLSSILSQAPQTVDAAVIESTPEEVRQNYNRSDFEEEVFVDDDENDDIEEPEPERVKPDNWAYKREAKRIVRLLDKGISMIIPPLYKGVVLEKDDEQKIRAYKARVAINRENKVSEVIAENDDILAVLSRYEKLDEMVKGVPLTSDEKEDLIHDLAEILKIRQKSFFSPEMSLLISVLVIVFARVEPVLSQKFKSMFN
jgi:hypothetical protein